MTTHPAPAAVAALLALVERDMKAADSGRYREGCCGVCAAGLAIERRGAKVNAQAADVAALCESWLQMRAALGQIALFRSLNDTRPAEIWAERMEAIATAALAATPSPGEG